MTKPNFYLTTYTAMHNIKKFSKILNRFGATALFTAVTLRTLISFASWLSFMKSVNFTGQSLSQVIQTASWATTHSNAFFNFFHSVWLLNHTSFAIAMHVATQFMGFAALILLAAIVLELMIFSAKPLNA